MKNNIEELLYKKYDERVMLQDLLKYYDSKLIELPNLKYIYTTWILDTRNKLTELDIEIQYLQSCL